MGARRHAAHRFFIATSALSFLEDKGRGSSRPALEEYDGDMNRDVSYLSPGVATAHQLSFSYPDSRTRPPAMFISRSSSPSSYRW